MANERESFWKRIRPHAEWEGIRWGWDLLRAALVPAFYLVFDWIRHLQVDWIGLGILFALALIILVLASLTRKSVSRVAADGRNEQQIEAQPQAQAQHKLSSLIPDGRLKIISAHYGVDGGPNADVAEEYLRPKVCGHSLAGWVGADLFGGFQPVIGLVKRVKVHYSFDGTEGTVSKKEHELLVLPDPSLVEIPRIFVTGLRDADPMIVPSFVDGRKHPIQDFVSLELKNCGKRDALWVRINPSKYPPAEPVALRLLAPQRGLFATVRSKSKSKSKSLVLLSSLPQHRQFKREHTPGILKVLLPPRQSRGISLCIRLQRRIVFFDAISESIAPTDFRRFYANVENQAGIDANRDLIKAMNEEWASRVNHATYREIPFPARIDFEDAEGTRFECNFTLIYHGGRGYNQPADFKCIECRDIRYRRIPRVVEAH